jgi:murein DD-endopeptidase MepM/ murein hydrolase activator NlpD
VRRLLLLVAVAALAALALPSGGFAQSTSTPAPPSPAPSGGGAPTSTDPVTQQLNAALAEQAALTAAKSALVAEVAAAQAQQSNLGALITANRSAIVTTEQQISAQQQALADASARAAAAHADADQAHREAAADRQLLAATVRAEYEAGQDEVLTFLLESTSFSELLTRLSQAAQLNARVGDLTTHLQAAELRARNAEAAALTDEAKARDAAAQLHQQEQTLQAEIANEQSLIAKLGSQAGSAITEISQIDGQTAQVAQQVADLRIGELDKTISDAEQAAWDEAAYYLQQHLAGLPVLPGSAQLAGSAAVLAAAHGAIPPSLLTAVSRLIWPAPGTTIAQGFGPSPLTFEPAAFGIAHFHTGIDLAGPLGTPIYAAADGVVATASPGSTGYGNHIVIALDGHTLTLYGHLQAMLVKVGDNVHKGQLIGLMGSTGNSTGPHLHFEVRIEDVPVDPTPLLPPLPPGATGPPALR